MLTIRNYHKLCNQHIGMSGWKVEYCGESSYSYEIKISSLNTHHSRKLELSRELTPVGNGKMAYTFYENGYASHRRVTPDYIQNMDGMLKALKSFTL